jgi:UPF0755 protein
MRRKLIVGVALMLLVAIGGAAAAAWAAWRVLGSPLDIGEAGVTIDVASGSTMSRVGDELASRGLMQRPSVLVWYARLAGTARQIKVGEYRFGPGTTPLELLDALVAGDVVLHQFTIVEGWRFVDMLASLRMHPAIAPSAASAEEIMAAVGAPDSHPEGQFLPDTYSFPRGTPDLVVLMRAHEAMVAALAAVWADRSEAIALRSPYEALILASIIEKETGLAAERPLISGVFNRRLARGIRLQTDPTVIYGLGDAFDGNLRRRDMLADTPYNTYTRLGLPPTPIALPGIAALEASVHPADGDALYFVATGRGDGSHYFSSTLEEHNAAVARFLEQTRNRD